jgi:hypothetical protein
MSALRNQARGEIVLAIDGAPVRLCLTLGALAELEAAFDADGFAALGERFAHMSASDLIVVLAALTGKTAAELAAARIDPREAASAVAAAFRAAFD